MKILVLHQPWPMGNYKLNQIVAEYLQSQNHEVYLLEQLNGAPLTATYLNQIKDLDFDVCYFEMLDTETFKVLEQLDCTKILVYTSTGILGDSNKILDYYGTWYTKVLTNSKIMYEQFRKKGVPCEHFKYYHSIIKEEDLKTIESKYQHPCVFLGMGFSRLTAPEYNLEREIYFSTSNLSIYGNGWDRHKSWKGILPPDDIGKLYGSAKSAVGLIAKKQRELGMINNRYTEIASATCPLISYKYPTVDWFGAEEYINFVSSNKEFEYLVKKIQEEPDFYREKAINFQSYMEVQIKDFYNKLTSLL